MVKPCAVSYRKGQLNVGGDYKMSAWFFKPGHNDNGYTEEILEDIHEFENKLKNSSLEFVIDKMSSGKLVTEKIKKILPPNVHRSVDSELHYAYDRARELNSDKDKEELLKLLKESKDKAKTERIYFMLSHLCKNRCDSELFNFLMNEFKIVKFHFKEKILNALSDMEKSPELNIKPLKELVKKRGRRLLHESLCALRGTFDPEVEEIAIDLIESTKNSRIQSAAVNCLETAGTKKCIPILEKTYKRTRDNLLRYCINRTLAVIKERINNIEFS